MRLGATPEGKLVSLQQDYVYERSMLDDYHENCGEATSFQYSVPNLRVRFGRAKRNIGSPSDMRGPGAVPGLYATESAMNELADELKIDPVRLRVLNEPKIDEGLGIPFSSRHFLECLDLGAEKFGWSNRKPEVGSMKRDGLTLGWGMAGAAWVAARFAAAASMEPPQRWHSPHRMRHPGHRHRHVHDPCAASIGQDRCTARQSRSGAWRYVTAGRTGLGRFNGNRLGNSGRVCCSGQCGQVTADPCDDDVGITI